MSDNTKSDCLPSKPSALIRVALADLQKCEKDKRYGIDMGDWHQPHAKLCCVVCLAGSVMAQSLGAQIGESRTPDDWSNTVARQLFALDDFRQGDVSDGLEVLGFSSERRKTSIPEYEHDDPVPFHKAMNDMADMLEREGL